MLTYSDFPLAVLTQPARDWIEQSIDPRDLTPWLTRAFPGPGLATITWPTGYPIPRKVRINRLVWPSTASRWGYMFGLADAATLAKIQTACYGPNGTQLRSQILQINSGVPGQDRPETLNPLMYLLPPIPLSHVVLAAPGTPFAPDVNNLYLLPFVDQRFYWWSYSSGPVPITGTSTSWTSLFSYVGSILGITIGVDTISPDYVNANKSLDLEYQALPPFIDALSSNVGQRIYVNLNNNRVFSQTLANAKANRENDNLNATTRGLRCGFDWYQDNASL